MGLLDYARTAGAPQVAPGSILGRAAGAQPSMNVPTDSNPQLSGTWQDYRTGYAPTGNAAENAWNNNLADAIAQERYGNAMGLQGPILGLANPGRAGAAYYKSNAHMMDSIFQHGLTGDMHDATYGGATGNIQSLLGGVNGMFGLNSAQNDQMRNRQVGFLDTLQGAAEGNAPSAAEQMLRRAGDQNAAAGYAQMASQRGMSNPAAMRMAAYQGAQARQDAASQAAVLRAQEMAQNRELYTNAMQGIRGQDQAWGQLGLQAQQARASYQTSLLGLQQGYAQMNQQDELQRLGLMTQYRMAGTKQKAGPNWFKTIGGAAATVGGVVAAPFTAGASLGLTGAGVGLATQGIAGQ